MIIDEIRRKIREVEAEPDSRLKVLRLTGLRVLYVHARNRQDKSKESGSA